MPSLLMDINSFFSIKSKHCYYTYPAVDVDDKNQIFWIVTFWVVNDNSCQMINRNSYIIRYKHFDILRSPPCGPHLALSNIDVSLHDGCNDRQSCPNTVINGFRLSTWFDVNEATRRMSHQWFEPLFNKLWVVHGPVINHITFEKAPFNI